jgi:hypothetical protein
VRLAGFEPATRCLEGSRSIQLSYRRRTPYCARSRSRVGHSEEPGWWLRDVGWKAKVPSLEAMGGSGTPRGLVGVGRGA